MDKFAGMTNGATMTLAGVQARAVAVTYAPARSPVPEATTDSPATGDSIPDLAIIGGGGAGTQLALHTQRAAHAHGERYPIFGLDTSSELVALALPLPGGEVVRFPADARLVVKNRQLAEFATHPDPTRYSDQPGGLLHGVSSYMFHREGESGGGGWVGVTTGDLEFGLPEIRRALRLFLRKLLRPTDAAQSPYAWPRTDAYATPRRLMRFFHMEGGTGSNGPAFLPLLPFVVRQEWERLTSDPLSQVAVVAGPTRFAAYHERTLVNWAATVHTLDHLSRHGLALDLLDGRINDRRPPYDRIILLDGERVEKNAPEAEQERFYRESGKALHAALASDLLARVASLVVDNRRTPFTTMRVVAGHLRWDDALAAAVRATVLANRLAALGA